MYSTDNMHGENDSETVTLDKYNLLYYILFLIFYS